MKTNRSIKWTTALGAAAILTGLCGAAPATAQGYYGGHDTIRNHIQDDRYDIRGDQDRLSDLRYRREDAYRCHDRNAIRDLDRLIADLVWHIANDRRDVHYDIDTQYQYGRSDRNYRGDNYDAGRYRNYSPQPDSRRYRSYSPRADTARARNTSDYQDSHGNRATGRSGDRTNSHGATRNDGNGRWNSDNGSRDDYRTR